MTNETHEKVVDFLVEKSKKKDEKPDPSFLNKADEKEVEEETDHIMKKIQQGKK